TTARVEPPINPAVAACRKIGIGEDGLPRAAYHEAGHAAAALVFRRSVRSVTIVPDESNHTRGMVVVTTMPSFRPEENGRHGARTRRRVETEIIRVLAGPHAERKGCGPEPPDEFLPLGMDPDGWAVRLLANCVCNSSRELSAYIRWLKVRTDDLLA